MHNNSSCRTAWKANEHLAQGNTLGKLDAPLSPCKGKSSLLLLGFCLYKAFSFPANTQGVALGYMLIAPSGRYCLEIPIHPTGYSIINCQLSIVNCRRGAPILNPQSSILNSLLSVRPIINFQLSIINYQSFFILNLKKFLVLCNNPCFP